MHESQVANANVSSNWVEYGFEPVHGLRCALCSKSSRRGALGWTFASDWVIKNVAGVAACAGQFSGIAKVLLALLDYRCQLGRGCRGGPRRSGAGPGPIFGVLAEAGFHGVLVDVEHGILEMRVVADVSIPVVSHPEVLWVRDAEF